MKPRMNIFKQYFYAVTNPKKYAYMVKLGGGRIFLYLLLLSLLSTICFIGPAINAYLKVGGISSLIENYIPDFSFKNGELTTDIKIDQSFEFDDLTEMFEDSDFDNIYDDEYIKMIQTIIITSMAKNFSNIDMDTDYTQDDIQYISQELARELEDESFYLYLDTSVDSVSELIESKKVDLEKINEDNIIIVAKKDYSVLDKKSKLETIETNYIESYYYVSSSDANISKSDITEVFDMIMPYMYVIFVVFVIIFIFANIISWLVSSLILAVIALIANAITHKHFTYGTLFKVAVYAHTTSIFLSIILSFIYNAPSYVNLIINWILPIVYIVLAILNMEDTPIVTPYNNMYNGPYNNPNNNMYNGPYNNPNNGSMNNGPYNNPNNGNMNNDPYNNPYNNNNNAENKNQPNNNPANDNNGQWVNPNDSNQNQQ